MYASIAAKSLTEEFIHSEVQTKNKRNENSVVALVFSVKVINLLKFSNSITQPGVEWELTNKYILSFLTKASSKEKIATVCGRNRM